MNGSKGSGFLYSNINFHVLHFTVHSAFHGALVLNVPTTWSCPGCCPVRRTLINPLRVTLHKYWEQRFFGWDVHLHVDSFLCIAYLEQRFHPPLLRQRSKTLSPWPPHPFFRALAKNINLHFRSMCTMVARWRSSEKAEGQNGSNHGRQAPSRPLACP